MLYSFTWFVSLKFISISQEKPYWIFQIFIYCLFHFKANFHLAFFSDHSIAEEEDEGEEYDDVDEDLKAQILGRSEAEQEKETTDEEGSDRDQLLAYLYFFFNPCIVESIQLVFK